jgi:spermidine synthase
LNITIPRYVEDKNGQFDVIIVDSSDPVGPAETLYTPAFYNSMAAALR